MDTLGSLPDFCICKQPPCDEYTRETISPVLNYPGESWFPSGDYTRESLTNKNNSTSIRSIKLLSRHVNWDKESCLIKGQSNNIFRHPFIIFSVSERFSNSKRYSRVSVDSLLSFLAESWYSPILLTVESCLFTLFGKNSANCIQGRVNTFSIVYGGESLLSVLLIA